MKAIHKIKELKNCDLIYGWFAFTPTVILGKILNIPILLNSVGYEIAYYPDFKYGFPSWWFPRALLRLGLKNTDFIISISKEIAKHVKIYTPEKKVYVIYEGINSRKFKCSYRNKKNNQITTIAYLSKENIKRKNLIRLIYAVYNIKNKIPNIKLVVIGKKLNGYLTLKRLVSELGLQNNIDFKGFISFNKLLDILCSSKIFVMPSLQEGFPTVACEALLCETPVITSNRPAMDGVFINRKHAILVDPYNISQLSNAIIMLLSNDKLAKKIADEGRKHVLNNFSYDLRKKKLKKILSLINKKINYTKKGILSVKWIFIILVLSIVTTLFVGPYKIYRIILKK